MSCSSCTKAKNILSCVTILTVGTGALSTAYYVYIKNLTTGRLYKYSVTSDGAGLITATISTQQWMAGHDYELWVTLATATNIEEKENITVDGTVLNCVSFSVERVYNNTDTLISGAQTLGF